MERKEKLSKALEEAREIVKRQGIDGTCPEFPRYVEMVFNKLTQDQSWVDTFSSVIGRYFTNQPTLHAIPAPISALVPEPSQEDRAIIDEFMKNHLEPEIKENAIDMLRGEIRDKLLLGGNPKRIKELLSKGKKGKLKRKKGCLYLEFGEGTPGDPISDSILILSA